MEDKPNNKLISNQQQLAKYEPKNYIAVVSDADILEDCKLIIDKALLFKGNNKTENEAGIMAIMFKEKIKKSYSHLTIQQIDEVLFDNNYGEGFGVSVMSLVGALEKSELQRKSTENKRKVLDEASKKEIAELHEYQQQQRAKANTPYAKKQRVKRIYVDWFNSGVLQDFNNEAFTWIIENELYDWTEQERATAKRIATMRARNEFLKMKTKANKTKDFDRINELKTIINTTLEEQELFDKFNKQQLTIIYFNTLK